MARVGVLAYAQMTESLQKAVREGLREHGYVEGRNLHIEWRAAEGRIDRAKQHAEELVRLKVDVIVASFTPAVRAAKEASQTIPIVMAPAGDPLGTGFVASLARPGGSITGIAGIGAVLAGKHIDLIRELVPGITRVGLLITSADPFAASLVRESQEAAKASGVDLEVQDVRNPQEVDTALDRMARQRAGALIVQGALIDWQVGKLATQYRLPSLSNHERLPRTGGLLSYGASFPDIYRRAASYVERILKGANPGDLPVELPTKFELVINMKTARALGLAIPQSILLRADRVIE